MNLNAERIMPAIWGGIECTINRVGDRYNDQLEFAGFYDRPELLKAVISLGFKTIRFPVLWEKHQPASEAGINWAITTEQLQQLRDENIKVIAGLLHHGSGPAFTNLLDENFPSLFANYAAKVATQFPWLEYFTPINEPLTTARFSGLYGYWYPHKQNDVSFVKILLNELKATVLAMHEIRKINPAAKLVQTEDLAKTYSTPLLSYQANFENQRRWLTFDILTGKLDKHHSLWGYFMRLGIAEKELQFFIDHPCVPDIIGVNYYVTSERYLDENLHYYPNQAIGGNTLHQYVDIEAVRASLEQPHGAEVLLREIWQRYKLPLAITEVHLHCTREEQLRWFKDIYEVATKLALDSVNIIAVTAWGLLGSLGWHKLLTDDLSDAEYETGAFDISSSYVRKTAVGHLLEDMLQQRQDTHPWSSQPGWWKSNARFLPQSMMRENDLLNNADRPVIIIGKTGTLGKAFSKICTARNIPHFLLGRKEADICEPVLLENMIHRHRPWAIINCAGYVKVDQAEAESELCFQQNTFGAETLSVCCARHQIKLMSFSSDLVFDGRKGTPYVESDTTNPLSIYGKSKQLAELKILSNQPGALIIRTSAFFGPWDPYNFVHHVLTEISHNRVVESTPDICITPTYIPHLVNAALDLLADGEGGIWHLANRGSISWFEFAKRAVLLAGLDASLIIPKQVRGVAALPMNSSLSSNRYNLMPSLEAGLADYFIKHPEWQQMSSPFSKCRS